MSKRIGKITTVEMVRHASLFFNSGSRSAVIKCARESNVFRLFT